MNPNEKGTDVVLSALAYLNPFERTSRSSAKRPHVQPPKRQPKPIYAEIPTKARKGWNERQSEAWAPIGRQRRSARKREEARYAKALPAINRQRARLEASFGRLTRKQRIVLRINAGLRPLMPWYPALQFVKWPERGQVVAYPRR